MRLYRLFVLTMAASVVLVSGAASGQEDCSSPMIFHYGDTGGADTILDLSAYANDYDLFCGNPAPGPDVVFMIEAYGGVTFNFRIINKGDTEVDLLVLFTFTCEPSADCNAPFYLTFYPDSPITFSPTVYQPIFVVVDCPDPPPSSIPLRITYSDPDPIDDSTWGIIKTLYMD